VSKFIALGTPAHALGLCDARVTKHPCQALAKRLVRHEDEQFQFVLIAGLSADNNLAERSIRPLVAIRKICGDSGSAAGTKTSMALTRLVETWQARRLNRLEACCILLCHRATVPAEGLFPQSEQLHCVLILCFACGIIFA